MLAVVTGGAGRLGNLLVRRLLELGHGVRVLEPGDAPLPALAGLTAELRRGSVLSRTDIENIVAGADVVFHLAAKIELEPDRDGSMRRLNILGSLEVARACRRFGARMVHCSSHHALERAPLEEPLHEGKPLALRDRCAYHRSKARAEHLLLQQLADGLDVVVGSPATIVGPGDYAPGIFGRSLIELCSGRIPVLLDVLSDYVDARDAASAFVTLAERGRRGERYLLSGQVHTMGEVAAMLERVSGRPMPRRVLPLWVGWALLPAIRLGARLRNQPPKLSANMLRASVSNRVVSNRKARAELGFSPRPLEDSLRDELAFYRERGWLDG